MSRVHLLEIEDQPWCPTLFRDAVTGLLELILRVGNYYAAIVPRLASALKETHATEVLDLCSGGGGPWLGLLPQLGAEAPARVILTDKYPNTSGTARVSEASGGRIVIEPRSVDATAVPSDLSGFRTLFTSLHHFRPNHARAILADACRRNVGIGVFEVTERSPIAVLAVCFSPLAALIAVPFLRPLRWPWLLFTYILPVIPLLALFDGVVSCFRTYSPAELRSLIKPLESNRYTWEVGQMRTWRSPVPITYLIGYPARETPAA